MNISSIRELARYAIVGVANNTLGYLIYLAVTWLGLDPKLTVSLLYPIGATIGYFSHARYSFAYDGCMFSGGVRYSVAHAFGYLLNIGLLFVLHDKLHFPHQLVQIIAIFVVAGFLFILFKYFVFAFKNKEI